MPSLAETQRRVREAVVTGDAMPLADLLVGGRDPQTRLAIHQRHYQTSLMTAIVGKFPATAWLVGTPFLTAAARAFVRDCPPKAPCIAEYGDAFPEFLATRQNAAHVPYLRSFAELEWAVGLVSIAVDEPYVTSEVLAGIDAAILPDLRLRLQPGLRYVHAGCPVDDLMKLYLTDSAPDNFALDAADTWIQVRGARGAFDLTRLEPGDFAFRQGMLAGESIGAAAERALDATAEFDVGDGLIDAFAAGLITGSDASQQEHQP
jgi:hypothetical protein